MQLSYFSRLGSGSPGYTVAAQVVSGLIFVKHPAPLMICSSLSPLCMALEIATKSEMAACPELSTPPDFPVGCLQQISLAFKFFVLRVHNQQEIGSWLPRE